MSVGIHIRNAVKRYGDNTVIPNLSMDVKKGEFFTLLGPSGCGKTTLLRMVAGFNTIEGGDFYFDETRINDIHPSERNIGMVFQNYAIFPHLTVFDNVAFGLKNRKKTEEEITEKVNEILEVMQIKQYQDRMPANLSGGQQQRVALARALVVNPDVLLMDEPLSNLDAKLRVEMRTAIKLIQRQFGITTIYVTHDQEEAMSVSDRIAVMNHGEIQQISTPKHLYHRPANLFVASFIGRNNVLDGSLSVIDEKVILSIDGMGEIEYGLEYFIDTVSNQDVKVSIRPEEFVIDDEDGTIKAKIEIITFLGNQVHYRVKLPNGEIVDVIEDSTLHHEYQEGDEIHLGIKDDFINIFNEKGDKNLLKEVESLNEAK